LNDDISILPDLEAVIFVIVFKGAASFSPETESRAQYLDIFYRAFGAVKDKRIADGSNSAGRDVAAAT
jgi:hypothetical protein